MYTTLRMLHIIFGIFIGGAYLFIVPILEPRLRRLGPAIQGPVINALMPVLTPVMMVSFVMVIGFGILAPTGIRLNKLGSSLEGRAPSPEEGQRIQQLSEKIERLSRINF